MNTPFSSQAPLFSRIVSWILHSCSNFLFAMIRARKSVRINYARRRTDGHTVFAHESNILLLVRRPEDIFNVRGIDLAERSLELYVKQNYLVLRTKQETSQTSRK